MSPALTDDPFAMVMLVVIGYMAGKSIEFIVDVALVVAKYRAERRSNLPVARIHVSSTSAVLSRFPRSAPDGTLPRSTFSGGGR